MNNGINININPGNQGIHGLPGHGPGCYGPQHPNQCGGPRGQIMQMMQMMLQMMSQLMGGQQNQNCGCCPAGPPSFGCGNPMQPQAGINLSLGASFRGFLG